MACARNAAMNSGAFFDSMPDRYAENIMLFWVAYIMRCSIQAFKIHFGLLRISTAG
jgi:hypothetical protein